MLAKPARSIWARMRRLLGLFRPRPYATDYSYQFEYMRRLPAGGVILDVSSGHNPFPRATILSDRWLEKNPHRLEELVRDARPFVKLDIHHLPFKDKSVDYIYCSHVLEHVDRPERACAELVRAGKAGYVETPTLMKDALFSWARDIHHRWHVTRFENRLVFFEYDERRLDGVRSTQWQCDVLDEEHRPAQDLHFRNLDLFNTILEWVDRFEVTVYRRSPCASS